MSRPSHASPLAVSGLYVFAALLVLSPLMDLVSTVWPPRPGDFSWRYGFLGLLAGYLHTPILGLVLAMAVAFWQGHARALRITGALGCAAGVALLLAMGVFALDVVQMRAMRASEVRGAVLAGGALQELKYFGALVVLILLGLGGWRTASRIPSDRARADSSHIVSSRTG
jgi:hypothetical protein